MWNVILCDDQKDMCALLRRHLETFSQESGETFQVQECYSGEELLELISGETDLVFLDIRMGEVSGMEAARALRQRNYSTCLIFITTMTQYAIEGYSVHAFGFLKKPVRYPQFRMQMQDTVRHLEQQRRQSSRETISLRSGAETYTLEVADILYVEVQNHDLHIVRQGGSLTIYSTISSMEEQLEGKGFFRCHKSFLVNLSQISRITRGDVHMVNQAVIPVSKHRRREFLEAYIRFAGGEK